MGLILRCDTVLPLQYGTKNYAKLFYHYHKDTWALGRNSVCVSPLEHYLSNDSLSNAEQKNFFRYKEIDTANRLLKSSALPLQLKLYLLSWDRPTVLYSGRLSLIPTVFA